MLLIDNFKKKKLVNIVQSVEQWVVAPKVISSSLIIYLMFFFLINRYNLFFTKLNFLVLKQILYFLNRYNSLTIFFSITELLFQEGLLIDFLQKKITDNWIKKFIIFSSNLLNDRKFYDNLIKFFLNLIITPLKTFHFFEVNNISNFFFFILIFFTIIFVCLFILFLVF